MAVFPVELIENIIAHAYGEYRPLENPLVLHQCALVCRTWRTIAQSFIFSEILLSADIPDGRLDVLRENDYLSQSVRTLWLGDNGGVDGGDDFLNLLRKVRQLYVLEDSLVMALVEGPTAERFMGNLTSLCLEGAAIPFWAGIFYLCHSLRELKMTESEFEFDDMENLTRDRTISRLRSLHIAGHGASRMKILQWMLTPQSPFDLTGLTTFWASDSSDGLESFAWIQEIVKVCAPTLQDLMVNPPTSVAVQNPNLTSESLLSASHAG
ncbi:hypothetical protein BDN72DRAFT_846813 [Pluteus cervinus]|uniref:Uncharacterized protein n=1 Tax=Pluteus cervinus TaxID=181527 RepID=A0ACD3AF81_9AGAR|nr:hypothetical protein BDN72DRAFT_846813 [Pluteus cervinus]